MQDERALQFASEDIKADKEVMVAAVILNGDALRFPRGPQG